MNQIDKIMSILERNQYQVILHTTDVGFTVQYPEKIEYPAREALIEEYFIGDDGFTLNGTFIPVKKYAQLSYAISLVVAGCKKIKYSPALVRCIYNNKDVDAETFWESVPFNMSEDDTAKTTLLQKILNLYVNDVVKGVELASENEMLDEIKLILDILKENVDE